MYIYIYFWCDYLVKTVLTLTAVVTRAVNEVERKGESDRIKLDNTVFRKNKFSGTSMTVVQWTIRGGLREKLIRKLLKSLVTCFSW